MKEVICLEDTSGNLHKTKKKCDDANKRIAKDFVRDKTEKTKVALTKKKKKEEEFLAKLYAVETAAEFEKLFNEALVKLRGKHFKTCSFKFKWYGPGVEYWSKKSTIEGHMTGAFTPVKKGDYTSSNIVGLGADTATGSFNPTETSIGFRIFLDKYPNLARACQEIEKEKKAEAQDNINASEYAQKTIAHAAQDKEVIRIEEEIRNLSIQLREAEKDAYSEFEKNNPKPVPKSRLKEVKDKYKGFFS